MPGYYKTEQRLKDGVTPVDNIVKFGYEDGDFEEVEVWHEYTPEELAQIEQTEAANERQEIMDALPDAVAELSEAVSDGAMDSSDLADALAELSAVVSGIMEVINNG